MLKIFGQIQDQIIIHQHRLSILRWLAIRKQAATIREVAPFSIHPLGRAIICGQTYAQSDHRTDCTRAALGFVQQAGADPLAAEFGQDVEIHDFGDVFCAKGRIM